MRHYMTTDDREALSEYRHDSMSRVRTVHPRAHGAPRADTDLPDQWDMVADVVEKSWNVRPCKECASRGMVILAGILLPCSECYGMGHTGQPIHARHIGTPERIHYRRDGANLTEHYRAETVNDRTVIFRRADLARVSKKRANGDRKPGRPRKFKLVPATPGDATLFYTDSSAIVVNQRID